MSQQSLAYDDVEAELRALAVTARPVIQANPQLADVVIRRLKRRRRFRIGTVGVVGGVGVAVAVAAAVLPGQGDHYAVIEPSAAMEPTVAVSESVVFSRSLEPGVQEVVIAHAVDGATHF
ncbi:MAG TPA: hypothetical protein VMT88_03380, partial [Actinomycetes bacterium]|nr:hypothetical protein [Actinomycetes bacterium]